MLVHIDMIASQSCCRFVSCTSMMQISSSTTSQKCSIGLRFGDCGDHLSKVNSFHVQEASLRWFELCDMVHYPAGSSIRQWVHCSHKGMDMVSNNTRVGCGVWQCSIGTKGPKMYQENIPHTITPPPPAWTVETRQDGSMLSWSLRQILTLPSEYRSRNRDSSDQAFFQSSIVQFLWACVILLHRFPVLSWQERHAVWSSAAVAHLLQCSMCCVFRDGLLHTLVVTSGYLSFGAFLLSLTSPPILIWHQQGIFVHTTAAHWIFSLFRTILCKP